MDKIEHNSSETYQENDKKFNTIFKRINKIKQIKKMNKN